MMLSYQCGKAGWTSLC